ncbi:Insulin-like [Cinara cedri]|uniref:Insulin-like n=1 Tax=Cinara cedri TaxID=506608 RepID=A0A5E4NJW1_9HEMI|nr:Insulin-like [Cinara cedri]
MKGAMKVLLLVLFLVSLAIESSCRVLTYEWDKKWYYCGHILRDIMEQACVRRPDDAIPQMRKKRSIGIATRCCRVSEERIDPEINGCSINDMLNDYCDHPERADRSKPLKIIENGGISSATDTFKNIETTATPYVTSTTTNSNKFSTTTKLPICRRGLKRMYIDKKLIITCPQ